MMKYLQISIVIIIGLVINIGFGVAKDRISDINNTIDGDIVTISRDIESGDDQAELYLSVDGSEYYKVNVIDTYDKSYDLNIKKEGEYKVRFQPNSGGMPEEYDFSVGKTNSSDSKDNKLDDLVGDLISDTDINPEQDSNIEDISSNKIISVPKTGPKEIIFIILGVSIAIYLLYSIRTNKKSK